MIYTVTLNPSLDYIVSVEHFKLGLTNRTGFEQILPGGKGINVSIVLKNLGICQDFRRFQDRSGKKLYEAAAFFTECELCGSAYGAGAQAGGLPDSGQLYTAVSPEKTSGEADSGKGTELSAGYAADGRDSGRLHHPGVSVPAAWN